ncbi:MAG TPA: DNA recombination protein RmuC, partial [Gammaproteobacteria bacterium]|nr:DNA recombination protein RmuC [Gammaproteobacteria bacterium]
MVESLLISITAFAAGFAAAWAFNLRTRERLAEVKARADEQARAADDKLELVADARAQLTNAFKALSADALSASNTNFLQLASATLEKLQERAKGDLGEREQAVQPLVQPLREQLAKVDAQLGAMEKTREHAYAASNEQLRGLVETHLPSLRTETQSLVKALRQPTVRGRWGEVQLKRVVEMAGMLEHCDFAQQQSAATDDGLRRPDLVVRLPGGRQIVIDAKAPITAYLDAHEAASDDARGASRASRAARAPAHDRARPQGVLGELQPHARDRDHVSAGRDAVQRGAAERSHAHRPRR